MASKRKSNLKSKWILIAVAFVVLFTILYAALPKQTIAPSQTKTQVSPTIDPATANWKTYNDPIYGFQLKFPPNWENVKNDLANSSLYVYDLNVGLCYGVGVLTWNGSLNDYLTHANIDPATTKSLEGSGADEAVTMAKDGYTIESRDAVTGPGAYSIYKKGGSLFFINAYQNPAEYCTSNSRSTFKFTK